MPKKSNETINWFELSRNTPRSPPISANARAIWHPSESAASEDIIAINATNSQKDSSCFGWGSFNMNEFLIRDS
ncbi:MAG: hypothetical protein R2873_04485 [Caldilineaceae bacterium]